MNLFILKCICHRSGTKALLLVPIILRNVCWCSHVAIEVPGEGNSFRGFNYYGIMPEMENQKKEKKKKAEGP